MGNCLPVVFGSRSSPSASSSSAPRHPSNVTSYTNPLALPHNSAYVNNLYERSHRAASSSEEASAEQLNRVRSLLSQIPAMDYRKEMGDVECAICMGELDLGDRVRYLPCMHLFHMECVDDWLSRNFACPSCMEPVDSTMLSSQLAHNSLKLSDLACSPAAQ